MNIKSAMLGTAMLACLTGAALANPVTVTWNFSANVGCAAIPGNPVTLCNSDYHSSTVTFADTTHTYDITARGFDGLNAPAGPILGTTNWTNTYVPNDHLFGKFTSGDPSETGLGLVNEDDNEIDSNSFIQFDFSALPASTRSVDILISSLQSGESATLWGSTTSGKPGISLGELVGTGANVTFHYDLKQGRFLSVSSDPNHNPNGPDGGSGNNILLASGFKATIPEPGTLALFGAGLAGVAAFRRRKKKTA